MEEGKLNEEKWAKYLVNLDEYILQMNEKNISHRNTA